MKPTSDALTPTGWRNRGNQGEGPDNRSNGGQNGGRYPDQFGENQRDRKSSQVKDFTQQLQQYR